MGNLDRREFLKLAGLSAAGLALPRFFITPGRGNQTGRQNVLVVVYDAFSASDISLYGYPRNTTPNIDALAERAMVFHRHHAGGNFTTPGTSTLLTGALPWSHRATNFNDVVSEEFAHRTMFHTFEDDFRMAYSHNLLANTLLDQFHDDISDLTPWQDLFLHSDAFIGKLFPHDDDIATLSWIRAMKPLDDGSRYSMFLSALYRAFQAGRENLEKSNFPLGLPYVNIDNTFILEDATDFLAEQARSAQQPFFGYFHFLPPHFPYKTRKDFYRIFANDGFRPPDKPLHAFTRRISYRELLNRRTAYDEYIRYVDAEFGRLFAALEEAGVLEDTWLVLTSDHGELFERGISGHNTALLHEPLIHIPLLIFAPGQSERIDIDENTSAVDVLPTLMHLTGGEIPTWTEGRVLPPFNEDQPPRDIYSLQAIGTGKQDPIEKATAVLIRGNYKLIYFFGYHDLGGDYQLIELYDLENDPEELHDLSEERQDLKNELLAALRAKIDEVNVPYG